MDQKFAVTIFGPTASGKTSLAIKIAQNLDGIIINADSRQIYQEMPIITAMPSDSEFSAAKHVLFDFLKPGSPFSVGDYVSHAKRECGDIFKQDKLPIFAGGTGFYLKVLMEGLSPIPDIPEEIVTKLTAQAKQEGSVELYKQLKKVDPHIAKKLKPEDTHRIIRGLAVYQHTQNTLSSYQSIAPTVPMPDVKFIKIAILPKREILYKRIHDRFDIMLKDGVVEEAQHLYEKGYIFDNQALTSLGLKEIFAYIEGKTSLDEACANTLQQMRRYAKRQTTWLHNQYKADILLESCDEIDKTLIKVKNIITLRN